MGACASSLRSQGMARCPTCRGYVRADYDCEAHRLVFSNGVPEDPHNAIDRLLRQARPRQCKILEQYARDNENVLRPCALDTWNECVTLSASLLQAHMTDLGLSSDGCS